MFRKGKFAILLTLAFTCISCSRKGRSTIDKNDGKSSLAFVFDVTGSMYNDLRQVREGAEMILSTALKESNLIEDFVFVPFHDPAVGPATVTRSKEVFQKALNIVRVYGGGDCPEMSLTGIHLALNVSQPRSFLYVFTDATAADHKIVGKVLDTIQRKQSQVVFILTGHCNDLNRPSYKVYQQVAAASSGQIFNLNKTSVHKMLEFVKSSIKGRTVNLASASNPAGYNYTQEIPVDSTLGEVTVSVSGSQPKITVIDPKGEQLTGPPKLITTLDLAEIMVVKVMQPDPGNWTITVGSDEDYSVKVVGLSNLTFNHGFSAEPTNSMDETSYRPLKGTYNHLMVTLSPKNVSAEIQYAEILTLNGSTLFEVPLTRIPNTNGTYVAEPFIPPDEFFYIAINGHDKYKQEIRRIGATAIQAKLPDIPYLTAPQKVDAAAHSRVVLSCGVESLVPLNAKWTKDGTTIKKEISSLQTTTLDYIIEEMKEEHVGTYRCSAQNIAGTSSVATELTIIVPPPQVNIEPDDLIVEDGETVTLTCTVYSEALLMTNRFEFNGTHSYGRDLDKKPTIEGLYVYVATIVITKNSTGRYSCIAENRGGISKASTVISIRANPTAHILGPHTLHKSIYSNLQLVCAVEDAWNVIWTSPNGTIVKSTTVQGTYSDVYDVQNVTSDGIWNCTALRDNRKASDLVSVIVLIKPRVKIDGAKNITVVNGTVVQISCVVDARPAPRILWHRETENFLNNTITELRSTVYRSVLTLNSSAEAIAGTYFCFGENSEGIDQDSITIHVRRKMTLVKGFSDQSVQLYYQVELQCIVDVYPSAITTWYHNDTALLVSDNIHMTEDNTTVYLKRIDFGELGEYKCIMENEYDKLEVRGNIRVEGLAPPILSKEPVHLTSRVGQSALIPCRVLQGNPEPIITWQFKNAVSKDFASPPQDVVVNDRLEITIAAASDGHSGIYRCVAHNVIGQDSYDVHLIVQYPPQLLETKKQNENQEVRAGQEIKLSCAGTGVPRPVAVWTKEGRPLVFTNNMLLNASELVIQKLAAQHSGTYTCTLSSALGSTQKNYTLVVYDPPVITSSNETAYEVLEGQLVELPCSARGLPAPIVEWTQNGEPVDTVKLVDDYGLRFVANLTDFGNYTCTAKNKFGTAKIVYTLYVWVPPFIVTTLEETRDVLVGSNSTLRCDVIGFPLPTVQWAFDEQLLKENTSNLLFNEIGDLFIVGADAKHEGQYMCVAENIAGIDEKAIYLRVNDPPKIMEDNYTGTYIATSVDTELSIACHTTGRPKPYVMWAKDYFYLNKDPRYLIESDGTLHIMSPSEDMSGNYTCVATNRLGQYNKTVAVQVYSLPVLAQAEEALTKITLVEGSDALIECPVRATSLTLKWYKKAKLLTTGPLYLRNVSRNDAATYSCVATNLVGSAHSKVQLIVQWPPRFLEESTTVLEQVKGDDCYLHCDVDAKPNAKTRWLFKSKPLVFEDGQILKLLDVQLHNAGIYRCIVSNIHGTVVREFTLKILEPPFISEFDMMDVQLKQGDNASLECKAKGTPTPNITWTYNNTNWQLHDISLSAMNITSQHEGIYRCDAINRAGITHLVYRLTVVFSPLVQEIIAYVNGEGVNVEKSFEVIQGSHIRISCKASGNPVPDIQWLKQGRALSENRFDIDYADLTLSSVETSHAGTYTCVAANEGGTHARNIKLDVLEPPKIFQSLFESNSFTSEHIEVISGQSLFLRCHPYGNPIPEVYWFKNDISLKIFDDTMVSSEFGEVIEIKNAIEEQSGNYTCVATNKVGNTSMSYLVDVLVPPPSPKESIKKVIGSFGKTLTLSCPALGSQPSVMWIKHPYNELNDGDRISLTDDRFNLTINNTIVSDSGNYSCIVTNKVGTTEITFNVVIQKRPSIAGNVGSNIVEGHVVPLRRSIVLKCEIDGNPTPQITWLKDTQELSDSMSNIQRVLSNSLLAIWSAEARDAGQYICVAENQAGTAHRRYNIAIQVPGKWSPWSVWSLCNVTCGLGYQARSRLCHYVDDHDKVIESSTDSEKLILDESACKGPKKDRRKCHMPPCEVDESKPRWSQWSQWSECSATCGSGTQARTRRCKSKARCLGDNVQIKKCTELPLCSPIVNATDNDVQESNEDVMNLNRYLPEATFEIQPEVINSHYSSDVEEFYSTIGSQSPTKFFDVDVTDNLDGSERGPCAPGYRHNITYNSCDDLDECTMEKNHCHSTQVCVNTAGGYRCSCSPGYMSLGAGQRCLDINECELETDGCEYSCVNTAGGYVCACPRHLRLHIDGHHCVIPSLYRKPYGELEPDYISTTIDFPTKYSKPIRNI